MTIPLPTLKWGLLLFWSVWLSVVFLTNGLAGLRALGLLPERWKFASGNYEAIQETISTYAWPAWAAGLLFLGVILWQGLAVLLFWQAGQHYTGQGPVGNEVYTAFAVSLGLWAAFMLADELFIHYRQQSTHMLLLISQLLTLLALHL